MKPNSRIYNRKNIRLKGFDYSRSGSYFVTICTRNHESFFGIVLDGEMHFNDVCRIAMECWENLSERFSAVSLDESGFMPNHLHGIINILDNHSVINEGAINRTPTGGLIPNHGGIKHNPTGYNDKFVGAQFIAPSIHCAHNNQGLINHVSAINRTPTLGMVVRLFKALVSRQIRLSGKNEFGWQRNYYEHIIRNDDSLKHIREYIETNPLRWELDSENPYRKGDDEFDRWLNSDKLILDKSGRDKSRFYR